MPYSKHISVKNSRKGKTLDAASTDDALTTTDDEYNELYDAIPENDIIKDDATTEEEVDVAIVGAGIGGLCAGSILNTLYGMKVGVYESHYLAGGCAHAFERIAKIKKGNKEEKTIFTFDSGPTIVLGCSARPYNPLRQVLNAVGMGNEVDWIRYDGW
eukprot:10606151-Ditylum_brightwellii.AAC.1